MTEKEIALEMEKYMLLNGAEKIAFETIVGSGVNSANPHAKPTDKRVEAGEPIVLDFGCSYNGYTSDMTRTIFLKFIPEEIKPIYDLVLLNQEKALEQMIENGDTKKISNQVVFNFKQKGYELIHALGHGVGMETHEKPYITNRSGQILKENMVVTVEPGIYIPNRFGVRIEDTVLVKKEEPISLTKSKKEYVII